MSQEDFSRTLVVGISSRALFDLDTENQIFEEKGVEEFRIHQHENRDKVLNPGTAFPLVKALLRLNDSASPGAPKIEVILMSRNHPDVVLRVFNSIETHQLGITSAALTGGNPVAPYLGPFQVNLFLSKHEPDVVEALRYNVPAAVIYQVPEQSGEEVDHVRIAFDGDCVLFSDESQRIMDNADLATFLDHEERNALKPIGEGPFATLLKTIKANQESGPDQSPFQVALVTARSAPAHKRAINTLESWGVRVDQAFFLGGRPKEGVLEVFRPHIFFDDAHEHCERAAGRVPVGRVPREKPAAEEVTIRFEEIHGQFVMVCKRFLRKEYDSQQEAIETFYAQRIATLEPKRQRSLLEEFEASIVNTPKGDQRRAGGVDNTQSAKLMRFLEQLVQKHGK